MFEFANTWVFWLLPLPALAYLLLPPLRKRSDVLMVPFLSQAAEAAGVPLRKGAWVSKRNLLQWILLMLSWCAFLVSLARPQIVGKPDMQVKTARSFLIAADISFSMSAKDWVVDGRRSTRWEAMKEVMKNFIRRRDGDRLALVFFGTNAYLQTPFTTDLEVVDWFLEETDVGMAGQMTGIGKAIGFGIRMFQEDTLDHKVMLLLTDGSDSGKGMTPEDAAYLAKQDSIKIYTLGIGDPEVPGSDLDEGTLKNISRITGGRYFRAIDQEDLEEAYNTLESMEPMEFEEQTYRPVTELFYYPLIVSVVLVLMLLYVRALLNLVIKN